MNEWDNKVSETLSILSAEMQSWFESFIQMLPNLCVATVLLTLAWYFAKGMRTVTQHVVGRFSDNEAVTRLLGTLSFLGILLAGLFISLSILNLDKAVTSLLAGAGVIGLVLGFAFQELSANFISGIFIAFKKPFKLRDVIKVSDLLGKVEKINLRATVIRTFHGQDIYIPNKTLLTQPVFNYTNDPRRLIELQVGVSYSDDLQKVENVALKALQDIDGCAYPEETKIYFREFGDSSIQFVARFWIDYPGQENYFRSTHSAVKAIKKAFDENDITIPFPIRTLDMSGDMSSMLGAVTESYTNTKG